MTFGIRPEDLLDRPLAAHAARTLANSHRWFPPKSDRWSIENQAFGIAGESGEIVEHVKKWHRGDFDTDELTERVRDEVPDLLTYLFNLSAALGIDLDAELASKQAECERRWGTDPKEQP